MHEKGPSRQFLERSGISHLELRTRPGFDQAIDEEPCLVMASVAAVRGRRQKVTVCRLTHTSDT
jgi:hypothetical protein